MTVRKCSTNNIQSIQPAPSNSLKQFIVMAQHLVHQPTQYSTIKQYSCTLYFMVLNQMKHI